MESSRLQGYASPNTQKFEFRRWTGEVGRAVLKQLRLPVGDLARLQPMPIAEIRDQQPQGRAVPPDGPRHVAGRAARGGGVRRALQ